MKIIALLTGISIFYLLSYPELIAQQRVQKPKLDAHAGVFTKKQVEQGSVLFTTHCASCHGRDLRGTEGGMH
ncbi:c-type cytochrome [Fibrella sp. ES10-3-2-2]|nr:hypothetical protein A6C57_12460 [Fibrella sp. ES10-3-2-2]